MPRQMKAIGPAPEVAEAAPAAPAELTGTKTGAIKAALNAHPNLMPKDIAEMLQAQGWDVRAQLVSVVKSNLKTAKGKKKATKSAAKTPAAAPAKAPSAAKDSAISLDSLKKAKELAAELGGIDEAKAALAALSELLG
jgi:hypothetical protein